MVKCCVCGISRIWSFWCVHNPHVMTEKLRILVPWSLHIKLFHPSASERDHFAFNATLMGWVLTAFYQYMLEYRKLNKHISAKWLCTKPSTCAVRFHFDGLVEWILSSLWCSPSDHEVSPESGDWEHRLLTVTSPTTLVTTTRLFRRSLW